jgi:hypothetical protein
MSSVVSIYIATSPETAGNKYSIMFIEKKVSIALLYFEIRTSLLSTL